MQFTNGYDRKFEVKAGDTIAWTDGWERDSGVVAGLSPLVAFSTFHNRLVVVDPFDLSVVGEDAFSSA